MGEELETYILKKLDDAIQESRSSSEFHFAAKFLLPKLHKDFIELRDLILKKRAKIKSVAAAAAAAASSKKLSNTPPALPHPRPAAANVAKIPDPSAPATAAVTGGLATHTDSAVPASASAAGVKEDSKLLLPAGSVKKSKVPRDAGDDKDTGASTDAGHKKDTDAHLDAGEDNKDKGASKDAGEDKKDTGAPKDAGEDNKDTGAHLDAGDKDTGTPKDAGDDKESDAPKDAGDLKETGAPGDKEKTDAPSDVAGDKKEVDAPSDDVAGDKKESTAPSDATSDDKELDAPLARTSSKTTTPHESKDSTPAKASVTSGGPKDQHESDTHTTAAKPTSPDESEITPATDAVTADKSIIPPASAGDADKQSKTLAKTSTEESQISPVTDDGATDRKSKTPHTSATGGKKESGVPTAAKSGTTDASTKSDSNTKPVNEEDLLREQLYYLNNVLNEWQMIAKKPFSYSSDSYNSITDLSKTLKKIKQDLKPEKTEESSHSGIPPTASTDNTNLIRKTPEVVEFRWSTRLVNPERVYGFQDKILSLERLLVLRRKDTDTFKAFGIHGMAGVGKTTLCQSIFSRPKVSEYFFPRIWVCLSKQKGEDKDNKKEVVKRMMRCLGIDDKIINKVDEKQGIRGLLFALRLQLTGKRYFIVLDDAHNTDEWFKMPDSDAENDNNKIYEKFSYGLPKECGGTVIVTSRVEQVVKNMVGDEENLRCIEPLTDEDTCWKIFKDTVEEDGTQFPEDLTKLKLEIVKRCDGLPLAAKLLGQIKHKELRENPTLAGNQRAALQAGNQQAAGQAGNQQAAIQAGNQQAAVQAANNVDIWQVKTKK